MRPWHLLTPTLLLGLLVSCAGGGKEDGPAVAGAGRCAAVEDLFERATCFADLAERWEDRGLCDRASHDGVRYRCYAAFAGRRGDARACQAIPAASEEHGALRDRCLADVAKAGEDADLCGAVAGTGARDGCYLAIARSTGEAALCEKIAEAGLRRICAGSHAGKD